MSISSCSVCHVFDGNGEDREYAHFLAKMYYEQDHADATSSAKLFLLVFSGPLIADECPGYRTVDIFDTKYNEVQNRTS